MVGFTLQKDLRLLMFSYGVIFLTGCYCHQVGRQAGCVVCVWCVCDVCVCGVCVCVERVPEASGWGLSLFCINDAGDVYHPES